MLVTIQDQSIKDLNMDAAKPDLNPVTSENFCTTQIHGDHENELSKENRDATEASGITNGHDQVQETVNGETNRSKTSSAMRIDKAIKKLKCELVSEISLIPRR